jgi:ferritin
MGTVLSKRNKTAPLPRKVSQAEHDAASVIQSGYRGRKIFKQIDAIKQLFEAADENKDGRTTRIEFLDMLVNEYQGKKAAQLQAMIGLPFCSGGHEKAVWLFKEACYKGFQREGKHYEDPISFAEFTEFLTAYNSNAMRITRLRRQQYAFDSSKVVKVSEWERPMMGHHNFMGPIRHALEHQTNLPKDISPPDGAKPLRKQIS